MVKEANVPEHRLVSIPLEVSVVKVRIYLFEYVKIINILDVDDCALGTHNCDVNADCTDTFSGWTCECHSLYRDISDPNQYPLGKGTKCYGAFCTVEDVQKLWLNLWPEVKGCANPSCDATLNINDAWRVVRRKTKSKTIYRYGFRTGL